MEKLVSLKLYEQVADRVKTMVLNEKYQKGDLLPSEKTLMDLTGVSRITVREAIKILSELGIIETKKGKGSIVLLDRKDLMLQENIKEIYDNYKNNFMFSTNTRIILEPEFARNAAKLVTEDDILILEDILDNDKNVGKYIDDQSNFHKHIVKMNNNHFISKMFDDLLSLEKTEYLPVLVLPHKQKSIAESIEEQHRKILEAIKYKNEEFAYFYMKEHLLYLNKIYEKYFENYIE